MKEVHNFCAGPCILPKPVFEQAAEAVKNFNNTGLSILEISHRSEAFVEVIESARKLLLEMVGLSSSEYSCLFLHGGASQQFLMIPQNFLSKNEVAGYLDTGTWSSKAIKEAKLFGEISILESSKDKKYSYIPQGFNIPDDLKYIHYTSNNTIYGTQMKSFPKNKKVLTVCDMSSDFLSRPIDYSQFDLIYAGAQKNIGPAGTVIVILKKSIFESRKSNIPSILNYDIHNSANSMFNTPPVFSIYVSYLNLLWMKNNEGLKNIFQKNQKKADLLYSEIDRNPKIKGLAEKSSRSMMNVTFEIEVLNSRNKFDLLCKENNIVGINGHRSVGGYRASLYNALSIQSVQTLVDLMKKL